MFLLIIRGRERERELRYGDDKKKIRIFFKKTHLALWDRVPAEPDSLLRVQERRLPEQALLLQFFFYVCRQGKKEF